MYIFFIYIYIICQYYMYTDARIKYNELTFIKTIRGMGGDKHFFQNELLLK